MGNLYSSTATTVDQDPPNEEPSIPEEMESPIEMKPTADDDESFHEGDEEGEMQFYDNQDEKDDDKGDENDLEPNNLYQVLDKRPCCGCCIRGWPRTCALSVGVVMPLLLLTFLSFGFGAILAGAEGPGEIDANNARLVNLYYANLQSEAAVKFAMSLPRLCFLAYMSEQHNVTWSEGPIAQVFDVADEYACEGCSPMDLVAETADSLLPGINDTVSWDPANVTVNVSEFFVYMIECGGAAEEAVAGLIDKSLQNAIEASESLSFNWIRCYPGPHSSYYDFRGGQLTVEERQATGQAKAFTKEWNRDREALFSLYYAQNLLEGAPGPEAFQSAVVDSVDHASGRKSCVYNVPAAAWFWFTVQTTVGYGNQAPSTTEGRALIYTVGFMSIVAFGGILAMAGYILSRLSDDFVKRHGMHFLAHPSFASMAWGFIYYGWMVCIAFQTINWKENRLDIDMNMRDAYWFSFISTTTVGLGDIFLEPEGITGSDVVIFPFMFLIGFTFLSAFLGKFAEFLSTILSGKQKSFVDTLLDHHVSWGTHCCKHRRRKETDNVGDEGKAPLEYET
mmetsp:Transcript_8521/g.23576  ORF Transcript_8521/g.23576 Transcript_8521/m.23576 type:complete len:564 (-) Transcript_8521:23-1714(-)